MKTQQNKTRSTGKFWSLSTPPAGRVSLDPVKKFRKVCTWLKKHISHLDYGYKWRGSPIHCNTNEETIAFLLHQRKWLGGITREKFAKHFTGQETFYFTGCRSGYSLVMVDIDCHKRGTLKGAKSLGTDLLQYFPNLYTEVSTNGNGVHGYFLVEVKSNTNVELKRLEDALDTWLLRHPHDVEMVEIKGLAPTLTIENRRLVNYKAGTLAKVPREAVEHFEELTATTSLTLAQLGGVIEQIEADCGKSSDVVLPELPPKMEIIAKPAKPRQTKAAVGSITGKHINTDRLENYEWFAEQLLGDQEIKTTGKHKVTITDIAICLMILRFCSRNMNVDGSLPTKRVKAFWDALYSSGEVPRMWNAKRYAAIRNWLSATGKIDWQDETYRLGCGEDKGQAAKWRFNDQFLAELEGIEEEREEKETSFIDTRTPSTTFLRPVQVWIDSPQRLETLKLIEMTHQVMLLYDQAA